MLELVIGLANPRRAKLVSQRRVRAHGCNPTPAQG